MANERWTANQLPDMSGRTVVVTGASSGIGAVTAAELARAGASVVLAVRNVAKGERAAAAMSGRTEVRQLDLTQLASVREFAEAWTGNLLLAHIRGRVVTVTSDLHKIGRINVDDLNWEKRTYKPLGAYCQSKLANVLFTLELQRRLTETGSAVRAVSAHPGVAETNLITHVGGVKGATNKFFLRFLTQDVEHGALPTLYAATQDVPGAGYVGPNGFIHVKGYPEISKPSKRACNADLARKLWDVSARLTNTIVDV